jgi:hypothetical protein
LIINSFECEHHLYKLELKVIKKKIHFHTQWLFLILWCGQKYVAEAQITP